MFSRSNPRLFISRSTPLSASQVLGLVLLVALTWFGSLDYRHLIPTDEGRYAQIAREMWASGDWLTPRYNGYKYFEKPPLHMWATALTYHLFGVGEWQARLWPALTGFLTLLGTAYTAQRLWGSTAGILSGVLLLASPMWSLVGHFNALDMGVSAMMAGALCSLLIAQDNKNDTNQRRHGMWACWAFMGFAVLSKGLIGIVLPGLVLVIYTAISRDWHLWLRLHFFSGLSLFLLITAPWFIAVSLENPEFPAFFFIHEHFSRFSQDGHNRNASILFFVPLILLGCLPWLTGLLQAIWHTFYSKNDLEQGFKPKILCVIWAASIFVFFSVSHSKLPGYITPVFPALALLTGQWVAQRIERDGLPRASSLYMFFWAALMLIGVVVGSQLPTFANSPEQQAQFSTYLYWVVAACGLGCMGLLSAWWLSWRTPVQAIVLSALAWYGFSMTAGLGHESFGRGVSGVDLAQRVKHQIPANAPLYAVRMLDHTFPFYLGRTAIAVAHQDELAFGIAQEPEKWIPDLEAFKTRWHREPQGFAMVSPSTLDTLRQMNFSLRVLDRDERRILITHP
jgi:4-amino-4-deoxy-L-arabinose transferase-like glycosyltransferase